MHLLQLFLIVSNDRRAQWWLERRVLVKEKKGLLFAKIACWWIFWQSFPLPPCCLRPIHVSPSLPPSSYPSHCRCRLQGWQSQVWIDRKGDEGGEREENETHRIDGTQVASIWMPVFLPSFALTKCFSPLIWLFIFFHTSPTASNHFQCFFSTSSFFIQCSNC